MRLVIQRVSEASVSIAEHTVGRIGRGVCLLLGIAKRDTTESADYLARKISELRIFEDRYQKMNCSLIEAGGEILIVSQFTLYGDCTKGRRPSFDAAAPPDQAQELYDYFVSRLRSMGLKVQTGQFQARMEVSLRNDGPVTFILDSR